MPRWPGEIDGTTARVVAVVDALARGPKGGVGVRQLAADLEISRSAVHRILHQLAELGVARLLPGGGYEAGPIMVAWGAFLAHRHGLLAAAAPIMQRVSEAAQETTYLLTLDGRRRSLTVVAAHECTHPVRYVLDLGAVAPLVRGAAGKAVVALLADGEVDELALDMEPEAATRWRADLVATRRRGYAVSFGERIPEACGVAAAFELDGRPGGALTISLPKYRMRTALIKPFGALVRDGVRDLSALLNAPAPAVR